MSAKRHNDSPVWNGKLAVMLPSSSLLFQWNLEFFSGTCLHDVAGRKTARVCRQLRSTDVVNEAASPRI